MINSGLNKYNVQPVCPYYPEDYHPFYFTVADANTVLYTASANTVLLIFFSTLYVNVSGAGNGIVQLKLRETDDSLINYILQVYGSTDSEQFWNQSYFPPVEVSAGRDLYLTVTNVSSLTGSLICVERTYE